MLNLCGVFVRDGHLYEYLYIYIEDKNIEDKNT